MSSMPPVEATTFDFKRLYTHRGWYQPVGAFLPGGDDGAAIILFRPGQDGIQVL